MITRMKSFRNTREYSSIIDNHYSVGLLRKENNPTLPYSKSLSLSRFHSLEKKFRPYVEFAKKNKNTVSN